MSNFLGQLVVQEFGHVASLLGSLMISFIPILVFAIFMPETLGRRGHIELEPVVLSPIKKFRKSLDAGDEGEHLSIVKGVHNYEGCV